MNILLRTARLGKDDTYHLLRRKLSKTNILSLLQHYGFIECANAVSFLEYVCDNELLERDAFVYIYAKVCTCLREHDTGCYGNHDDFYYFQKLRVLKDELEFILSIKVDDF